eukprot:6209332-Pleurochrysis_carterae.AAC.6
MQAEQTCKNLARTSRETADDKVARSNYTLMYQPYMFCCADMTPMHFQASIAFEQLSSVARRMKTAATRSLGCIFTSGVIPTETCARHRYATDHTTILKHSLVVLSTALATTLSCAALVTD